MDIAEEVRARFEKFWRDKARKIKRALKELREGKIFDYEVRRVVRQELFGYAGEEESLRQTINWTEFGWLEPEEGAKLIVAEHLQRF
jgi:ribosomal protein L19E